MLNVETYGDPAGAPLLAVHGVTAFGARFGRLADRLPERRWLCPDLRGHGASPSTPPWRTEEHVADLIEILDRNDIDRADVIGHSFGGHVALHLLATAPGRVDRLVLFDPASLIDPAHAEKAALAYARDEGWPSEEAARQEISSWFPNAVSRPDYELEVDRNLMQDEGGRWRLRFSPLVIVAAYGEVCRPLPDLPSDRDVLLLEADPESTTVNDDLRKSLEHAFGDRLQRVVVPGGTHVIFRTHLEETAAPLRSFLA